MSLVEMYEAVKDVAAPFGQVGRSIAHIHVGLALFVGCSLLTRRGMASGWPLFLLVMLELLNEAADLAEGWPHLQAWRIRDTVGDFANTMLWPVLLFMIARAQERKAVGAKEAMTSDATSSILREDDAGLY
ncbi:hypothetical protein [Sphingomonas desiccabilis]|uniref:Uncharacterized protein n=1 Tax=Sphingomonas desiccabilis TaxID=429134 RepID=A0A4Q2IW73_9SPHN|nr:hypothetical protein [Sphingomonas desiccabilis]MBB3909993.1 hypothetical protein [Sphingomonas desiccabilis]RXZ34696.1 hypothetical protein EO081_03235 [Sphingomonas desiccabilis]